MIYSYNNFFCFLIAVSALFGVGYASAPNAKSRSLIQKKIIAKSSVKKGKQSIEESLQKLFSSEELTKKLLSIDGQKIGIIFNPQGKTISLGIFTINHQVIVAPEPSFPNELFEQILENIPKEYSCFTSRGTINGKTSFEFFGFE